MKNSYSTDNECLLTGGFWALVAGLFIGGFCWFFVSFSTALWIFVAVFVGFFVIAYVMCKNRTVGRDNVTESAVAIARAEMETSAPEAKPAATPAPTPTPKAKPVAAPAPAAKPKAEPKPKAKTKPKPAAKAKPAAASEAGKPKLLTKARGGKADDLKKIKGVGPKLEKELNGAGVFHFDQIAGWSADEVAWADQNLVSFKGRVSRDNWVSQAKELATN